MKKSAEHSARVLSEYRKFRGYDVKAHHNDKKLEKEKE
jgi:hypothetical protein